MSIDPTPIADNESRMRGILSRLAQAGTSNSSSILRNLIHAAAETLGVEYAFIGELAPDGADEVRIVEFFSKGKFGERFDYKLHGTPCQNVVSQRFRYYPQDIQTRFPDPRIKKMGVQSYAAIPLFDSRNRAIGLMGVMSCAAMSDEILVQAVLNILSVRAAAELERRDAIEAHRHSEASYRTILESAEDAAFVLDFESGAILDVNNRTCESFGYSRAELLAIDLAELCSGTPPYTLENAKELIERAKAGETVRTDWHRRNKDGSLHWDEVLIRKTVLGGQPRILILSRDITERKRAEQERLRLEAQLRQSQKMEAIGHLTGGIAHDFNNILNGVMGYIGMAQERLEHMPDDALIRYMGRARHAVERASDLIRQMQTFSRGQRGAPQQVKLPVLVRNAIKLLESTLSSSIEIETSLANDVPPVSIDPVHLEQVLLNLCINARDAMNNHGRLEIDVARMEPHDALCSSCLADASGKYAALTVRDAGCGIDARNLDRLFEPFFTTKEVGKGSGMGLAVVHGIVHEHGGHILLDSAPGRGTAITILLPLLEREQNLPAQRGEVHEEAVRSPVALQGRVLLVDDDTLVREYMHERLTKWGLLVSACESGMQALELFEQAPHTFDVAIIDQTMPKMTGMDLAQRLYLTRPDLPVLIHTGYSDAQLDESATVHAVLKKPVDEQLLLRTLHDILR
jgi:PAS domain S-box-containing protein